MLKKCIYHPFSRLWENDKMEFSMSFSDFNIHRILASVLQTLALKIHRSPNSLRWCNTYQALNYNAYLIYLFNTSMIFFYQTKHSTKKKYRRKKRDYWGCFEEEWSAYIKYFQFTTLTITIKVSLLFMDKDCHDTISNTGGLYNIHAVSKWTFFSC